MAIDSEAMREEEAKIEKMDTDKNITYAKFENIAGRK